LLELIKFGKVSISKSGVVKWKGGDFIKRIHPALVWVTEAGYRLRPPQWK
jgi:hypothetical protein